MALQEEFGEQGKWLFRYRGVLPIIILGIGLAVYLFDRQSPNPFYLWGTSSESYYELACLFVGLIGLVVRIYTVGYTPRSTSGRGVKKFKANTLNTKGSYSLVRHPLYVGNFLMWLGPTLLTANLWFIVSFCLFYWVYYERIMYAEEGFLRVEFPEAYFNWSKNVPAFVPNFQNFQKPDLTFNWKRVLQKERNGLAALMLIFSMFEFLGEYIKDNTNYNNSIFIATIIAVVLFVVLKFLEKKTDVLTEENI